MALAYACAWRWHGAGAVHCGNKRPLIPGTYDCLQSCDSSDVGWPKRSNPNGYKAAVQIGGYKVMQFTVAFSVKSKRVKFFNPLYLRKGVLLTLVNSNCV